jgi:ribosome-associated protein
MNEIQVDTGIIKLDAFLKWAGIASLGSEAKFYIKNEEIKLNGVVETQRGKKLVKGDIVEYNNEKYKIV